MRDDTEGMKAIGITYRVAESAAGFSAGEQLFREYAGLLPIDLGFQDFEHELKTIQVQYNKPTGALLLACDGAEAIGCVAVRRSEPGVAELKRMYLRNNYRRLGIGRALLERSINIARDLGYVRIRLDTLPDMAEALALYGKLGFRIIPAYRYNPVEDAVFLERRLDQ
ncbi:MAG: GNAT family N-acetyltransferase [Flavobacteriales bacterium]